MADTVEKAKRNIKILSKISESFGLKINKDKSRILIFNSKEDIREIEGIAVTEKIKYLGVSIDNDKDLFKSHRAEVLKKANIFSKLYKQDKRLGGTGLPPEVEKTWNVQPRKKAGKISHN